MLAEHVLICRVETHHLTVNNQLTTLLFRELNKMSEQTDYVDNLALNVPSYDLSLERQTKLSGSQTAA